MPLEPSLSLVLHFWSSLLLLEGPIPGECACRQSKQFRLILKPSYCGYYISYFILKIQFEEAVIAADVAHFHAG